MLILQTYLVKMFYGKVPGVGYNPFRPLILQHNKHFYWEKVKCLGVVLQNYRLRGRKRGNITVIL